MRAFVIVADGDSVATSVLDEPIPHQGDVIVKVEWSGVNFKDSMVVAPTSRVRRSDRLIGGVDAAGIVAESNNHDLPIGTPVAVHGGDMGVGRNGGFAEYVSSPSRYITTLPPNVSTRSAMILGTAGFTALASIRALEHHGLRPNDGEVLVTGATGGVGSWAVAALASRGYHVVASTGSSASHDWLRAQGASSIIGRDDIADRPERVLATERWAGAIDCVGGNTLHQILRSLRYGGAVAASGLVASAELATNVYPFITRSVALLGIDAVEASPQTRFETWQLVSDVINSIDIESLVDSEIALEDLPVALSTISDGATQGRILVRPN